ncbi:MAG: helix-turn-helix domain-containing protein [Pedobacter sp.]|nr:helix-turn-helix domain-containing protein [Pedobacter sp.]
MEIEQLANLLHEILAHQKEQGAMLEHCLSVLGLSPFPQQPQKLMTRQEVKDYLGISEATYKRKVKDGELRPMKMPGGHRFRKAELEAAYQESVRRGRV